MVISTLVSNVRPWGAAAVDVIVAEGRIAEIAPVGGVRQPWDEVIDGRGRLLLPSFSDVHVHLDSTRIGLPFRPNSLPETGRTIWQCVLNDRAHWREAEAGVAERATETLGRAIAHGMTRARSYAQVDADCGLERLEGVLEARAHHAARAEVQIVAFPQAGLLREPGVPELMDEALANGADVMGGIDPCTMDRDPAGHLDVVFALAAKHDVPIDIHIHEPGELGLFSISLVLGRVRAHGLRSRVTIAHAFALGDSPRERVLPVLDELAEWDIALTTIAPGPREGLPILDIVERGMRVGLGQDGQRDYWSPYGNTDMLDRTWQLAFTQGWSHDRRIETGAAVATIGGRSVVNPQEAPSGGLRPGQGTQVGDVADLVLLEGETVTSAVMDRLGGRTVLHRGRTVADDGVLV